MIYIYASAGASTIRDYVNSVLAEYIQLYYHVLWVAKYQRVSKHDFLRDRCRKLADLCLDR